MLKTKPHSETAVVPAGLRFSGPVTGNESFYSKGHTGEYLLALAEAILPTRLGKELSRQQGERL